MVDVRRLRTLRELADRGTVAGAARALGVTPPAVSQQLAALELEVGHRLTEPDGRRLRLTAAAQLLLGHADAIFAQLEHAQADLDRQDSRVPRTVRVGAFATALTGLVAPLREGLRRRHPALRLIAVDSEAPACFEALSRRELDLVISMEWSGAPRAGDPRLTRRELLGDPLDAALPDRHPLASRRRVDLADLAAEDWVSGPDGSPCHEIAVAGCRAVGFSPRVVHRTGDWASVLALVAAGFGVALVPRLAQRAAHPGAVVRALAGTAPRRHLFTAVRRGSEQSPATAAVLDALHDRSVALAPAA